MEHDEQGIYAAMKSLFLPSFLTLDQNYLGNVCCALFETSTNIQTTILISVKSNVDWIT